MNDVSHSNFILGPFWVTQGLAVRTIHTDGIRVVVRQIHDNASCEVRDLDWHSTLDLRGFDWPLRRIRTRLIVLWLRLRLRLILGLRLRLILRLRLRLRLSRLIHSLLMLLASGMLSQVPNFQKSFLARGTVKGPVGLKSRIVLYRRYLMPL